MRLGDTAWFDKGIAWHGGGAVVRIDGNECAIHNVLRTTSGPYSCLWANVKISDITDAFRDGVRLVEPEQLALL